MTSAHFFGLLDPSLVTVMLTQPISTIVSSSTPSVRTSYVNGPLLRVQRPRGRRSCPERRTHTRTRANERTDGRTDGRGGERNPFQKLRHTREREREGGRAEERAPAAAVAENAGRSDERTNSLREEEKAAATTVPPSLFHDEEDHRRIESSVIWSGEAKRVGKDGVIVRRSGRGLRRCGERKLRDDDSAVVR